MPRRAKTKEVVATAGRTRGPRRGGVAQLRVLAREAERLNARRVVAVAQARADGESWANIADALGMSKQAAWEYFTDRLRVELSHQRKEPGLSEVDAMNLAIGETKRARRTKRR